MPVGTPLFWLHRFATLLATFFSARTTPVAIPSDVVIGLFKEESSAQLQDPMGAGGAMSVVVTDVQLPVPGGSVFARQWHPNHDAREPILLLHDSLGSVALWRDFPNALAQATGRMVVAYDRLGFGRSTPRTAAPTCNFIHEEAELYFPALVQALDIPACLLYGHSVGGAMALTMAALHPDHCKVVITEAAQAFVEPRTLAGIQEAQAAFAEPQQFARLTKYHGSKAGWVLDAWTKTWLAPEFAAWSLDPYLTKVHCPVLAIHGDADEYGSNEFPRRITEGISGPAHMAILTACGHVPHREKAREVLNLAAAFIVKYA
jgi:pimeloyl-ACP methyl ester carboxylesterase